MSECRQCDGPCWAVIYVSVAQQLDQEPTVVTDLIKTTCRHAPWDAQDISDDLDGNPMGMSVDYGRMKPEVRDTLMWSGIRFWPSATAYQAWLSRDAQHQAWRRIHAEVSHDMHLTQARVLDPEEFHLGGVSGEA